MRSIEITEEIRSECDLRPYLHTDLGKEALEFYGVTYKKHHLLEELCELYVAVSHFLRKEREDDMNEIAEELCDVILLIDELSTFYNLKNYTPGLYDYEYLERNLYTLLDALRLAIEAVGDQLTLRTRLLRQANLRLVELLTAISKVMPFFHTQVQEWIFKKYEIVKERISNPANRQDMALFNAWLIEHS